ncbi:LysR family transcriptional regulator [Jatrophihabitans fulvus]
MLDVRRLRLLHEVHVRGTIAAVASALHLSPSAVSQQLSQLEKEAGHPLLRRAGRRLQLTPQGEVLVAHTGGILDRLERAESDLQASLGEATGTVHLAIFQSAALALIVPMLRTLARDHPQVRVTMTQREPETALLETFARDFDLVVAEQYPGHAAPWHGGVDRVVLTHDELRLAVPRRWRDVRTLADTAGRPWVVERHGAASRHFAEQACRQAGFEPDVRFETDDLQAHVALIRSGEACALVPDLLWQGRTPPVRTIELPGRPRRTVFTATRSGLADRPAVVAVRRALVEAVASRVPTDRTAPRGTIEG